MNENLSIKKERYNKFSPRVLFLFPLIVGLFFIFISTLTVLNIILQPNYLEDIPTGALLFFILVITLFFAFGIKGIYEAKKEYKFQKEHNIKWK